MNVYIDHCIMWVFYHLISEIEARACIKTWRVQISVLILITMTHLFRVLQKPDRLTL